MEHRQCASRVNRNRKPNTYDGPRPNSKADTDFVRYAQYLFIFRVCVGSLQCGAENCVITLAGGD